MQPFFSIITASRNNETTIEDTLESIRSQSFPNFEHIVVDGASTDNTVEVLDRYARTYNLSWISEPDDGISDALNKGLARATGTYIIVIQADDRFLHDKVLENAYVVLSDELYDICGFSVLVETPHERKLHPPSHFVSVRYHLKNVFRHQGTFVHRSLYDRVGHFDRRLRISMDYDFFYRSLKSGAKYYTSRQPIAVMQAGGVSRRQSYKRILEEFNIQDTNETNPFWRSIQRCFRVLYHPYRRVFAGLRPDS